jgi:SAM-dependent methyltransferase
LLDIGCGDGLFLDLCGKEGWTGFGVEVSKQAAARAEIRGITLLPDTWLEGTGSAPDHSEHFDVVTLVNVLDSLLDPFAALRRIKHALAPDGLVLIRVQNGAFHLPLRRIVGLIGAKYWQAFQLFVYTPTALRNLLRAVGLEPISMRNSALSEGPLTGAEQTGSHLIWRIAGAGFWTLARAAHAVSGGRLIWAPSFEVIARSEGAPA